MPKKDGKPGEGTWTSTYFEFADGSTSKCFKKEDAVHDGDRWVHAFDLPIIEVPPGTKCYLVLRTTRTYTHGLDSEPVDHFVGVVKPQQD